MSPFTASMRFHRRRLQRLRERDPQEDWSRAGAARGARARRDRLRPERADGGSRPPISSPTTSTTVSAMLIRIVADLQREAEIGAPASDHRAEDSHNSPG